MTVLEISAYYSVFGGVSYPRQYYNIYACTNPALRLGTLVLRQKVVHMNHGKKNLNVFKGKKNPDDESGCGLFPAKEWFW